VIVGTTLTVANAGDSRVVLCRKQGYTEAMSFDHKPMSDIESKRISEAGGFVNQFGRVNGNLNLSRSIGDLKYKQVPNITPAKQMITAEPDIKSVTLNDEDEFVILACDVSLVVRRGQGLYTACTCFLFEQCVSHHLHPFIHS
jgi:serine/threonine protein phosphatase PrpC